MILSFLLVAAQVVLVGDSTLQVRPDEAPQGSWGMMAAKRLKPGVGVRNLAVGGRSTRTYRDVWETNVLKTVKAGDWVVIQFGHNDGWKDSDPKAPRRETDPQTEYKDNLRRFVSEIRALDAKPVLVTSISLYLWKKDGTWPEKDPLEPWVQAMREVAAETRTLLVDLHAPTLREVRALGRETSMLWFMYSVNGRDWAHPTKYGARMIARLFWEELRRTGGPFAECFDLSCLNMASADGRTDALREMLAFARAAEKELRHTPTCGEKQSTFGSGDSTPRAVRTAICTMSVFDTLGKSGVADAAHWEKLAAEVDKTLFFAASVTAGKSPEIDFKCFDGRHWDKLGVWGFTEDFPRLEDADPFMRSNPRPLTVRTDPDWFPAPPQAELPVAGYYDRCAVRAERAYRASCAYRGVKYAAPGRDVRAGGFVGLNKAEVLSEGWYENGEYKLDADVRETAPRGEGEGPNTVLRRQLRVRKLGPRTALVRERAFVLKDCELPRGLLAVPFAEGAYLLLDGVNRRVDGDLFARAGETLYDVTYAVDADGDAARLASCRGLRMEPAYLTEPGDETETWQAKIDAASAVGGGTVTVPAGAHKVAQLELKDNVTLELAEGATLFAVTNGTAYRWMPWGKAELQEAGVVVAYGATNVGIVGKGTIDGCGDRRPFFRTDEIRWRNVYMRGCRGVRIEGVRLDHPSFWTIFLRACDRVHLKGVTSRASANINNDGMDLSVSNALIEDCDIDSEDDALVLKGFDPDFVSENVEIRNCRIATTGNCIKFGTETFSRCRKYEIHHCSIGAADRFGPRAPNFTRYPMTVTNEYRCESGLAFLTVDGGTIEDVRVHDIEIRGGVLIPFAFRLGHRYGEENWDRSVIRGVTLEHVTMAKPAFSAVGCFISGIAGRDVEDVTIRDCHFKMRAFPDGILRLHTKFPENARRYPSPGMFDGALPGYFLFTTHAKNVRLENVKVDLVGEGEKRPAVVADENGTVSVRNCAFSVFERCEGFGGDRPSPE